MRKILYQTRLSMTSKQGGRFMPLLLLVALATSITLTNGLLLPYGGLTDISMKLKDMESTEIKLNIEDGIPFLGTRVTSLWLNYGGSVTYKKLENAKFSELTENVAVCPFFTESSSGDNATLFFRQLDYSDEELMDEIAGDVHTATVIPTNKASLKREFFPTWALVATWSEVGSPNDPAQTIDFQLTIASDGVRTFALFNYFGEITWYSANGNAAAAGLFVVGQDDSKCSVALPGSQTEEVMQLPTLSNIKNKQGRFVMIISEPLMCSSNFSVECGELPRGRWGFENSYFEFTPAGDWMFYCFFQCKNDHHISPGVNTQRIECVYEPDYYEYRWSEQPASCTDLNATRKFDVKAIVVAVNNRTMDFISEDQFEKEKGQITDSLKEILELGEVPDATVVITDLKNRSKINEKGENETYVELDFEVKIPPYVGKKLDKFKLQKKITNVIDKDNSHNEVLYQPAIEISETTSECLQACLCRNKKKNPAECRVDVKRDIVSDACCGGCGETAKAYASSIKSCCNNRVIYDPSKSVCCRNGVRKGDTCGDE